MPSMFRPGMQTGTQRAHLLKIMVLFKAGKPSSMPVKLSSSAVLKWPEAKTVADAAPRWAEAAGAARSEIVRIGYFGSCATGQWGVGSDLDVFIELSQPDLPFERRGICLDTAEIPLGTDLLVYTSAEIEKMRSAGSSFISFESSISSPFITRSGFPPYSENRSLKDKSQSPFKKDFPQIVLWVSENRKLDLLKVGVWLREKRIKAQRADSLKRMELAFQKRLEKCSISAIKKAVLEAFSGGGPCKE